MEMTDRTSYGQSLTHMIKGNLGAGVLGMGSSFAHLGLYGALITLPSLCLISCYCVHLLVKTTRAVESQAVGTKLDVDYPNVARLALAHGPRRSRGLAELLGRLVDSALLVTQVGVCCVYIVFVVDNVSTILTTYKIIVSKTIVFAAVFPVALLLSFIRTLKRLALASLVANLIQFVGLTIIIEYLVRDLGSLDLSKRDKFRPANEMALGFGSTMFAFEGISVVLPIYTRMRKPKLMSCACGVVNVSFIVILILYFIMGLLSYLKYGQQVRDSITLNLPPSPLYDGVRALFTLSILLSYPLQFYVPNEMIWKWAKKNLLGESVDVNDPLDHSVMCNIDKVAIGNKLNSAATSVISQTGVSVEAEKKQQNEKTIGSPINVNDLVDTLGRKNKLDQTAIDPYGRFRSVEYLVGVDQLCGGLEEGHQRQQEQRQRQVLVSDSRKYEYYCRFLLVLMTFTLAMSVPKLNLLMDLIGSFSGAALSLTIPALIHLAMFWDHKEGLAKIAMITIDSLIIASSLIAGLGGSVSSMMQILREV